jgi:putative transposase
VAEVLIARGGGVAEACRHIEVTGQTYFRWRKECGRLKLDQAR